ncbi:MAG: hypothetical protein P8P56_14095 [Yoonia sp.]|nr:hypothetical protein [Yoonia sp.]
MQTISQGYKGLSFLVKLSADRLMIMVTLVTALYVGSYLALV